jgi:hypothetical protein
MLCWFSGRLRTSYQPASGLDSRNVSPNSKSCDCGGVDHFDNPPNKSKRWSTSFFLNVLLLTISSLLAKIAKSVIRPVDERVSIFVEMFCSFSLAAGIELPRLNHKEPKQ